MTTANDNPTSSKDQAMAAAAEAVRQKLGIHTLEDRNRDALDFHEIGVASLRKAIAIAFEAGWDAAKSSH